MPDRIGDLTAAVDGRNQVYYSAPTRAQRFWRFMGFKFHLGEDPPGIDLLPGWMQTRMRLHFSWADRLRLLFSGRLHISSSVYFDTPSPNVCKSRMDWHILPFNEG